MICCVCGHDRYSVPSKPIRFEGYEIRIVQCKQCRTEFVMRSVITAVLIIDPDSAKSTELPITSFSDAYREYLLGRASHPHYKHHVDA